jgi:hypothetical protein
VDAVTIPERVVRLTAGLDQRLVALDVRETWCLDEPVGDIDPEAVDAAVEPELEDRVELGPHLFVLPVEVGLGGVEQVEVPLAVVDPLPRRTSEDGQPVVRWLAPVGAAAVAEHVAGALR